LAQQMGQSYSELLEGEAAFGKDNSDRSLAMSLAHLNHSVTSLGNKSILQYWGGDNIDLAKLELAYQQSANTADRNVLGIQGYEPQERPESQGGRGGRGGSDAGDGRTGLQSFNDGVSEWAGTFRNLSDLGIAAQEASAVYNPSGAGLQGYGGDGYGGGGGLGGAGFGGGFGGAYMPSFSGLDYQDTYRKAQRMIQKMWAALRRGMATGDYTHAILEMLTYGSQARKQILFKGGLMVAQKSEEITKKLNGIISDLGGKNVQGANLSQLNVRAQQSNMDMTQASNLLKTMMASVQEAENNQEGFRRTKDQHEVRQSMWA
jgi:hypothetical protein